MPKMPSEIGTSQSADDVLRKLISDAIRQSAKSRAQIADELSLHVGQRISKRMLDDWTAESKKRARFPATVIEPFCLVLANDTLQRHVMGPRLRQLLRLGELQIETKKLRVELLKNREGEGRKKSKRSKR